ncbi:MAG: hypothetical protein NC293_00805 [Roseburia sp.]|nr:hypothetical protein [Roseburia sp.]
MRGKQKLLSWMLVFSMFMSLFAGLFYGETEVDAAEAVNQIELGTRVDLIEGLGTDHGYQYPSANIQLADSNKRLYSMSLSVDTGYMMTGETKINDSAGTGTVVGDALSADIFMEDLDARKHFQSMHFVIKDGATKQELQNFIRQVKFYTEDGDVQKVCICATAIETLEAKTAAGEKLCDLNFYNGHFYGYVSAGVTWKAAYKAAKEATFAGMTGYLLTLTSRPEDRFVHTMFERGDGAAKVGWMGCTRATTGNGYDGSGEINGKTDDYWDALEYFNKEDVKQNVWRWVCGPEAHIAYNGDYGAFGYQSDAWGYGDDIPDEGGFTPYPGYFANWTSISKGANSNEPNGGVKEQANLDEGYGYYGYQKNGMWNDHPDGTGKGYYIEFGGYADDAQNVADSQIIVITEKNSDDSDPDSKPQSGAVDANALAGKPAIVPDKRDGKAGTVLTADLSNVGPAAVRDQVTYQWYTVENGVETQISGATGKTYTTKAEDREKTFVVKVTGPESHPGILASDELIPIRDEVSIENKSKDKVREGTVLGAVISGVNPYGSHSTLTYQWYTVENGTETPIQGANERNYTLTSDDIGKQLIVKVTGNGKYYNTLASVPYDATRTNADIKVDEDKNETDPSDPSNPSDPSTPTSGKMTITVDPTMEEYVYALEKSDGTKVDPETEMKVVNGDGTPLDPVDADGYYEQPAGGTIKFTELDKDETYIVVKKKKDRPDTEKEIEGAVGPSIPDEKVKTEYEDKDTEDKKDDTITIIVDPAMEDSVYAVQKKINGAWVDIPVAKDSDGNYVPTPGAKVWSDGGENKVVFAELPADGTYKVVAKGKDGNIANLTPGEVIGGSGDIHLDSVDNDPTKTPEPPADSSMNTPNGGTDQTQAASQPTPAPGGNNPTTETFTKAEEDAASKFIKDHVTGPDGKIITDVTDLTRDILAAGAADWKKLTAGEKAAVNARLRAAGCKFTYDQLLKKANKYKIPGFKVIKFMKKNSKAKLKLIKCSGASIACTTTNKKVATVDKKGVITAKKPGRATLTFTAVKGKYTNRLVIDVRVKKKFKNAKELTNFKSKVIKTPTVLVAKKRLLKKSSKIEVYDLEKSSKVKFTPINKKILTINKKGKYTGKKKGSTLVKVEINQNKKIYLLYVYVTIY